MNNKLDDFSRDLAVGMSRRNAFLKFVGGASALGFLGLGVGLQKADATSQASCVSACLNFAGEVYDICQFECDLYTDYKKEVACFSLCFTNVNAYVYDYCAFKCTHPHTASMDIKEKSRKFAKQLAASVGKALA